MPARAPRQGGLNPTPPRPRVPPRNRFPGANTRERIPTWDPRMGVPSGTPAPRRGVGRAPEHRRGPRSQVLHFKTREICAENLLAGVAPAAQARRGTYARDAPAFDLAE